MPTRVSDPAFWGNRRPGETRVVSDCAEMQFPKAIPPQFIKIVTP